MRSVDKSEFCNDMLGTISKQYLSYNNAVIKGSYNLFKCVYQHIYSGIVNINLHC